MGTALSHLRHELLKQGYLHIEELHEQVLHGSGQRNTSNFYIWVYCNIRERAKPAQYFGYQAGRGRKYPYCCLFRNTME